MFFSFSHLSFFFLKPSTLQDWTRSLFCVLLWHPESTPVMGLATLFSLLVHLSLSPRRLLSFLKDRHFVLLNSVFPQLTTLVLKQELSNTV